MPFSRSRSGPSCTGANPPHTRTARSQRTRPGRSRTHPSTRL